MNSENYSLESSVKEGFQSVNEAVTQYLRDLEEKIRTTPLVAVSVAAGVGYLLRLFPIGLILAVLVRLFLFALKPVIIVFGAIKLYDFIREQSSESRSTGYGEKEREPLLDSPAGPPGV
jgi:hypothetical protein